MASSLSLCVRVSSSSLSFSLLRSSFSLRSHFWRSYSTCFTVNAMDELVKDKEVDAFVAASQSRGCGHDNVVVFLAEEETSKKFHSRTFLDVKTEQVPEDLRNRYMATVNSAAAAKSTEDDDPIIMDSHSDGYDADTFLDDDTDFDSDYNFLQKEDDDDRDDLTYSYYACHRNNYKFLWEFDIRQRMEDLITKVSTVLSVSRHEASLLLLHFNWSVKKVTDHWIVDESSVREKVGLLDKPEQVVGTEDADEFVSCGICLESHPREGLVSASCGHLYCRSCWSEYIRTSINNDGLRCLMLRCPEPSCHAAVTQDVIESSVSEEDKKKLSERLITPYIENRKAKWCPNPGCEYAIKFLGGDGMSYDVTCRCLNSFCWNCGEESHRPLDCETVQKWIEKTSKVLSQNMNYIRQNCKPCPNCSRPIEKNGGCMRIICCVCKHQFCWLCLKPHGNRGNCNGYVQKHHNWEINIEEEMVPRSLDRKCTHYFDRWDGNRKSKLNALSDFKQVKSAQYERLRERQGVPESHFDFITKAWLQIVECRRVLEWSYAYGYFMPEHETEKKVFFEHLQGVAESTLEKLHNLAEKELDRFLTVTALSEVFKEFRRKLVELTAVTACYFEKLVRALENGLSDIASDQDQASKQQQQLFQG